MVDRDPDEKVELVRRRKLKPRDPKTDAEWQVAVDAADACLALDAARAYGLVTGGPGVDVARCEWLLAEGKRRGVFPSSDAIERFIADLAANGVLKGGG